MSLSTNQNFEILNETDFKPASFLEIADGLMANGVREMYHAIVEEKDIVTLFSIPNLKIYWCCRCHHVGEDGSSAHEHLHALVHFDAGATLGAYRQRLKRAGTRLHAKTTFKKIICADHMIGILGYICCEDGQRTTKPDADGLMGSPHTHYAHCVFEKSLIHKRNVKEVHGCADIRLSISQSVKSQLSDDWKNENISGNLLYIHHHDSCLCDNGVIRKQKKLEANSKRREFFISPHGQHIVKKCKEKSMKRRELFKLISSLKENKNSDLTKETIDKLMKLV